MPEDGLGEIARAPVMEKERVPAHGLGQADAPERRRAPLAPSRLAFGPAVGEALAHVVQQEIGVRPDQLMRQMRLAGHVAGHEFWPVTARAADAVEDLLPLEYLGVARIASRRHRQVLRVEGDELEQLIAELDILIFGRVAVRRLDARGFFLGAIARAMRNHGGRKADIAGRSLRRLLRDGGNAGLPAEAAEHDLVMLA